MAMINEFLAEVNIGDKVELYVGNRTFTGVVKSLSDDSVQIDTGTSKPKIKIDQISVYDVEKRIIDSTTLSTSTALTPSTDYDEQILTFLKSLNTHPEKSVINFETIKKTLYSCDNHILRNELNKVTEIMSYAIKVREFTPPSDRLKRAIALTANIEASYGRNREVILLSGYLQYIAKNYIVATQLFIRAKEFEFALITSPDSKTTSEVAAICLYTGKAYDIALLSIYNLGEEALAVWRGIISQYKDLETEETKKVFFSAAASVLKFGSSLDKIVWPDNAELYSRKNYEYICFILKNYKKTSDLVGNMLLKYEAEINSESNQKRTVVTERPELVNRFIGRINNFLPNKFFGFISHHNVPTIICSSDVFFHLKQVNDIKLRRMLLNGNIGVDVEFRLGKSVSSIGASGDDIKLLSNSNLQSNGNAEIQTGDIIEYSYFSQYGKIIYSGKTITFNGENIIDPLLKAYLNTEMKTQDWKVTFFLRRSSNGNKYADQIKSADKFDDMLIEQWVNARIISRQKVDDWFNELSSDGESVLYDNEYFPLPEYSFPAQTKLKIPKKEHNLQLSESLISNTNASFANQELSDAVQDYLKAQEISAKTPISDEDLRQSIKLLNKSLQKEMELYQSGKLDSAVVTLIMNHMRLNEFGAVETIYNKYSADTRISKEKLLNSYIQAHERSKDNPKIIIKLYEEIIKFTQKQNTRMHFLLRKATLERSVMLYTDAIETYMQWEQSSQNANLNSQESTTLRQSVLSNLALCYYLVGKLYKAKTIAAELKESGIDNDIINNILNDTVPVNDEEMVNNDTFSPYDDIEFVEYNVDNNNVSEYLIQRIQAYDIAALTKSAYVKNNQYVGNPEQANDDIEKLKNKRGQSPLIRSNSLFCVAKIILQIINNPDISDAELVKYKLSEAAAYQYAARALVSFGDYLAQDMNSPCESVLYCYHKSLALLPESNKQRLDRDWIYSIEHSIVPFFYDPQSRKEYIRNQVLNPRRNPYVDFKILNQRHMYFPTDEVILGLSRLLMSVKQTSWYNELHHQLFQSNQKNAIMQGMNDFGLTVTNIANVNLKEFKYNFDCLENLINTKSRDLENALDNCLKDINSDLRRDVSLDAMEVLSTEKIFNKTDSNRVKEAVKIIRLMNSYDNAIDFEKRSTVLFDIISKLTALCNSIEEYPTYFAYDSLLQRLFRLRDVIATKRTVLFETLQPNIEVSQIDHNVYKDDNCSIRIQLSISNAKGHQMADNVQISIADNTGIELVETPDAHVRGVRGGESREAILTANLNQSIIDEQACDINVIVTYEYNDENSNTVKSPSIPKTFSLNLYSSDEFTRIKNPYQGKTNGVMESVDMFVGRDVLLDKLVRQIRDENGIYNRGHAVALYGQTRAGKSSILFHCGRKIRETYANDAIIVNYGSVGEAADSKSFFYLLIEALLSEVEDSHADLDSAIRESNLIDYKLRILNQPEDAQLLFSAFFRDFHKILKRGFPEKIVILLIDEFTYLHAWIKSGKLSKDFMKLWKAIMQDYGFYAIVVGQDNMPLFKQENRNEFAAMELELVTYLNKESAYKLMSDYILINGENRYRPEALERLFELTAGSAFLILRLCDKLVDYLNETKSAYITRALIDEFLRKCVLCQNGCVDKTAFEPQLQDRAKPELEDENERLLLSIARASRINGQTEISQICCSSLTEAEKLYVFDRLVERNVIEKYQNKYCKIVVTLLKEWLLYIYGQED